MAEKHYPFSDLFVGFTLHWKREITEQDIRKTIEMTGDRGGHHVDPEFARAAGFEGVIAPGLLQASLSTKLGGDLNFLAREINMQFLRPVYAGDVLEATLKITELIPEKLGVRFEGEVTNQRGETVMTNQAIGHLPHPDWGIPKK